MNGTRTPRRGNTLHLTGCGYAAEPGGAICGAHAVYEIDFGDDAETALACAEHAAFARRQYDVTAMWSL